MRPFSNYKSKDIIMNLLTDNIAGVYRKFFAAAFGSALITSIYSVVDAAMVGQYHGPVGLAAIAILAPVWNIIFSLGLLAGIGGSVLYAVRRGKSSTTRPANRFFTAALLLGLALSILAAAALFSFEDPLLRFFGGEGEALRLAKLYMIPIKYGVPLFVFGNIFMAFLRNDGNPRLATIAVISGGVFNVFGDYFFVFTCNMGIIGAAYATALGQIFALIIMSTHFFRRANTLRFSMPLTPILYSRKIATTGFSVFFIDIAMGILTVLFNRQILHYLGPNELAIYGVIVTVGTFVQCCGYGIGQAAQPILSQNFGAALFPRVKKTLSYSIWTAAIISFLWLSALLLFPNAFIHLFMKPTPDVLKIAPPIIRAYSLAFIFLPFNVFTTYYFQAVMRSKTSFIISMSRGLILSGLLLVTLPLIFGANSLWYAIPAAELLTTLYAAFHLHSTK
jgi:putative MATE family efflux protein